MVRQGSASRSAPDVFDDQERSEQRASMFILRAAKDMFVMAARIELRINCLLSAGR